MNEKHKREMNETIKGIVNDIFKTLIRQGKKITKENIIEDHKTFTNVDEEIKGVEDYIELNLKERTMVCFEIDDLENGLSKFSGAFKGIDETTKYLETLEMKKGVVYRVYKYKTLMPLEVLNKIIKNDDDESLIDIQHNLFEDIINNGVVDKEGNVKAKRV